MKKILLSLLFIFISCFISACNNREINESNYKPFDSEKVQNYETAKADNQESFVYIEGTLGNSFEFDTNTAFTLEENTTLSILIIGNSLTSYTDELEKYSEENVIAYGRYEGMCNVKDYGEAPMINIDKISITNENIHFSKTDLDRFETELINELDKSTIQKIKEITETINIREYYIFDKKTSETDGPTLSLEITGNTLEDMITAAEKIVNINELHSYERVMIICKDHNDTSLGIISYNWDKEKQQYYSSCSDYSDEKKLEKEYQKNVFFQKIDLLTLSRNRFHETIGEFYLNNN